MTTRLVQLKNGTDLRLALVKEPRLELLEMDTVYGLITAAHEGEVSVHALIDAARKGKFLDYDAVYNAKSDWQLLPPITHPEPSRCIITGTGLTHLGSAKNRNAMHKHEKPEAGSQKPEEKIENPETDSMKMFRWGIENGRPAQGHIGIAPEWFYKGTGDNLKTHNDPLEIPPHALDGGEEAEIAAIYILDPEGRPVRVGMTQGNEFSDHVFEKINYLNLAGSKLRQCSIGPELVINPDFSHVPGEVRIERAGQTIWSKQVATGEDELSHSLANIEHHHFKFAQHRRPGDIHVHFLGTPALSYADAIKLQDGDIMHIAYQGFGRPLRNTIRVAKEPNRLVRVRTLA